MRPSCPRQSCLSLSGSPSSGRIVRKGSFFRKSDAVTVARFRCLNCERTFSDATTDPCFGQNKRQVNELIRKLFASSGSLRRTAILAEVQRVTVKRKRAFLARLALSSNDAFLAERVAKEGPFESLQMDELETFEHTKCKPLSVALLVDAKSRIILGHEISIMPAKWPLTRISRKKYGPRPDHRITGMKKMLTRLSPWMMPQATITSDSCPRYPMVLREILPEANHRTVISRRGCVTGQGELKKIGFDPLFSLNHTCAMLRANVNRLARKTWCTTKKIEALKEHLDLYIEFHNRRLPTSKEKPRLKLAA